MKRTFTKYPNGYIKASSNFSDYKGTFTVEGGEYIQPRNLELDGEFHLKETKIANSIKEAARIAYNMKCPDVYITIDEYADQWQDLCFNFAEYRYSVNDIEHDIIEELNRLKRNQV